MTYGAANDPCLVNGDCGYGLDCVGADGTTGAHGKCAAEAAAMGTGCDHAQKTGAGCDPGKSLFCGKDDTCDAYGTASSGQPCAYVNGAQTYTLAVSMGTCQIASATSCH